MNAIDAIQAAAAASDMVLKMYFEDLSDADLMQRPHPGCNHLAWQLGHLIVSEKMLLSMVKPEEEIELPEGFVEAYSRDKPCTDNADDYHTKAEYLELFDKARGKSAEVLSKLSEEDLDTPTTIERMKDRFPTLGAVWMLRATHPMMHAGQFVPVRRELDKPIVI